VLRPPHSPLSQAGILIRSVVGLIDDDDIVYWYSIQEPLHRSGYASLGRVCTLRKVRTIRGCLQGLALMI
jgi:hypothetical protein